MRAALALAVVLTGCPGPEWVSVSSTIVEDGFDLLVTSPDEDAMIFVDREDLSEIGRREEVGASHVVVTADGPFVTSALARAEQLPCNGLGAASWTRQEQLVVACPHDDLVGRFDGTATAEVARPLALAVVDDVVHVASRDRLVQLDARTLEVLEEREVARPDGLSVAPIEALAVDPSGDVAAVYTVVDNLNRDLAPEDGGYGSVVDGSPRIQPWIDHPDCPGPYAIFDGGERVFSDPSAAAFDDQGRLWIVHRGTQNVAVLECDKQAPRRGMPRLVANQTIGAGGRGIVIVDGVGFVDVGFEHAVARVPADAPPTSRTRATSLVRWSPAALRGRLTFFDATNTHLTPSGILSCGTCHPGGGEDGLTWFFHTEGVPRKLRRTPPVFGANPGIKPLHWDGEFRAADTLVRTTITELMGGDGLVISGSDVGAFMQEAQPPPGGQASFFDTELYGRLGCVDCHRGWPGTDGQAHTVVPPSDDPDAHLDPVFTPTLRGVRARGPWLHDGRAATLRSVFFEHGVGAHDLSAADPDDVDRLLSYLESL